MAFSARILKKVCLDKERKVFKLTDWPATQRDFEFFLVLLGFNVISLLANTSMSDRNEAVERFDNPEDPLKEKHHFPVDNR